jgi:hypothetical protein
MGVNYESLKESLAFKVFPGMLSLVDVMKVRTYEVLLQVSSLLDF